MIIYIYAENVTTLYYTDFFFEEMLSELLDLSKLRNFLSFNWSCFRSLPSFWTFEKVEEGRRGKDKLGNPEKKFIT